jgi:hypothetical protein
MGPLMGWRRAWPRLPEMPLPTRWPLAPLGWPLAMRPWRAPK